jgi:pyruvate dehydrogenase E2 component (dihydrolipoamide acetyltransferase)
MVRSRTTTAPVTVTTRADAGALVGLRDQFKATAAADEPVPSLSDIIVKLVGQTLQDFPLLKARWEETRIVMPDSVHIGLAVDTPDGLLVPVIRDVPALSLRQLAARTRDLVDRARRRQLTAAELTGGSFTVTNLGGLGVDVFTPIINLPECAVLGVGRIRREPAVVDNQIVIRNQLWLSLTFDHRIVDGAQAARFLDALRQAVETAAARLIG